MTAIRVTIKDREAIMALTVDQIKKYLSSKGWYKKEDYVKSFANGDRKAIAELWSQDSGPANTSALLIPNSSEVIDYAARVSELLILLEQKENRSQLEIYADISQLSIVVRPKKISKPK